jgi:hypothetical protein
MTICTKNLKERCSDGRISITAGSRRGYTLITKHLTSGLPLSLTPGNSTAICSSGNKGILILKCHPPTSAHLEDLCRQEKIWDATKSNAMYIKLIKQSKKEICAPAAEFNDIWVNIATFCALLTLFGEGCDLYQTNFQILKLLGHPTCVQNKMAYTPRYAGNYCRHKILF